VGRNAGRVLQEIGQMDKVMRSAETPLGKGGGKEQTHQTYQEEQLDHPSTSFVYSSYCVILYK